MRAQVHAEALGLNPLENGVEGVSQLPKSGWSCLRKLGKEKKEKKEKKQVFPQGRIKAFLVRPYFFDTFLLSVVSQKFILFRLRSQNLWFMGNNFSSRRPLNGRAFWSDFALSNNKTLNTHIALFFLFFYFQNLLFFQTFLRLHQRRL